ncbi:chemotaxis protein CheA [Acidicapsa ligni]|uniref:chemotaxis protein CheA n=1 Tax=Acidicapsa ligni TaxID=542300 RepID=UPI0021DFC0D9|nr:chemotaxis protein CheA [Acidicapsa ligni]
MDELTREFLIESQEGLDRMERGLTDLEARPTDSELLSEIFRSVHTIKGTTGFLGFKRLEKLAHAGENLLSLLRDGKLQASQNIITGLLQLMDGLRSILHTIENNNSEGEDDDSLLIGQLQELQQPAPATSATTHALIAESFPASTPSMPVTQPLHVSAAAAIDASNLTASDSTLRVDVLLLNRMMSLVGELVLTRNQILQATSHDPNLTPLSRRLDLVTADLRESVMQTRMQPVSNVFSKFPRIIRDLSQSLNRSVRLVLEGQETELDKRLLEAIKDPLIHAVRNSLDHGIEPPDVRIAAGKDAVGTLTLRASQESGQVLIEVSDDGAGICVDRVRNKAIERGLIVAEKAAHLSDRELMQLIFLPGFSTAEAVTSISGRGVGMDVVRTNVEKIGGKVEIDSQHGKGTSLRFCIPLTLAILPALIVRSLDQNFALPQSALFELIHLPFQQAATVIEWIDSNPLYRHRGNLLPLIFLNNMLSPQCEIKSHDASDSYIAVLDIDGHRFGLVVDNLADPQEIVVRPLSSVLKSIGLYSGATVLGSGDIALILDPSAIAARANIFTHTN